MLELAAALCSAAGSAPAAPWYRALADRSEPKIADDISGRFDAWAGACGEVLAAMARALVGTESSWNGGRIPSSGDSLSAVVERVLAETACLNKGLAQAASSLRSEGAELVRRAGDVGSLERSVQKERARLREDLERCKKLDAELGGLVGERARVSERMAALQERLRLAASTAVERGAFEQKVSDAEALAARDRAESEACDRRLKLLEHERADLGERLARTRALIHELEKSPDRELCRRVHEIWRSLPPDVQTGGGHDG
jgi:chromosome segregation ATPase